MGAKSQPFRDSPVLFPTEAPAAAPAAEVRFAQPDIVVGGGGDKPVPLARWYATVTVGMVNGAVTVALDDDSNGGSTIVVPVESASPLVADRVIVDFREDGLVVVSAVVS